MTTVRRYRVRGRVQGVGFRAFVLREAVRLGVAGWVRNRRDGSVEALVAASPDDHRLLLEALRAGPRLSRVDDVETTDETGDAPAGGFDVLPDR